MKENADIRPTQIGINETTATGKIPYHLGERTVQRLLQRTQRRCHSGIGVGLLGVPKNVVGKLLDLSGIFVNSNSLSFDSHFHIIRSAVSPYKSSALSKACANRRTFQ